MVNNRILEKFWVSNPFWVLPTNFTNPSLATFIFEASQSKLSIKSYSRLKFFQANFW